MHSSQLKDSRLSVYYILINMPSTKYSHRSQIKDKPNRHSPSDIMRLQQAGKMTLKSC